MLHKKMQISVCEDTFGHLCLSPLYHPPKDFTYEFIEYKSEMLS